jgi:hypothetical protein
MNDRSVHESLWTSAAQCAEKPAIVFHGASLRHVHSKRRADLLAGFL